MREKELIINVCRVYIRGVLSLQPHACHFDVEHYRALNENVQIEGLCNIKAGLYLRA